MQIGDVCDILKEAQLGESAQNVTVLKQKFQYMLENYQQYETKKQKSIDYINKHYSRRKVAEKFEKEVIEDIKLHKKDRRKNK